MSTLIEPSEQETFTRPLPSRATRNIGKRSKVSGRYYAVHNGRILQFESALELQAFYVFCSLFRVLYIWEQPPAIAYTDPSGRNRKHHPDLLVVTADGLRILVFIKPHERAARSEFQDELRCIRAAVRKDYADKVVLVTDAHFTSVQVKNAERLHAFRERIDHELSFQLDALLPYLSFPTTIKEVLNRLGCSGSGFKTVFAALYDGRLSANVHEEITPETVVTRGEGQ